MQVPGEVLRGGSTSGAPSALPLFLSPRGGWGYPVSLRGGSTSGAPPLRSPHGWAYPAHTRGSFRFTTKGTKGVPGLCPWTPRGGPSEKCFTFRSRSPSPCGSRTPSIGFQTQQKTDLPLWFCEQIGLVFSSVSSREHSLLSIRGTVGWVPSRMLEGLNYCEQYR